MTQARMLANKATEPMTEKALLLAIQFLVEEPA